jgi:uncharacterized protein (TIGR03118 family)
MLRISRRNRLAAAMLGLMLSVASTMALAQFYTRGTLVKNLAPAKNVDPQLVNAWGITYAPSSPFWISDQGSGFTTIYNAAGLKQGAGITVPPASGSGPGSPTGIVYNGSTEFKIMTWTSAFLFATLDGTISGWSHFNPGSALVAVNNSGSGANYTGLAITSKGSGNFIYAADIANNKVDVYDGTFKFVTSFTDKNLPAGFAPFGIQDINGQVYVAFADVNGGPGGYIDIFTESGSFVKTLIQGAPLNQPWGMAVAPSNFGPLSNTLLVSNNINFAGTINGFDLNTGAFVGTIRNKLGNPIKIDQLWGIKFGGGSSADGQTNQLFFTAGPKNNVNGLFGVIKFKP